MRLTPSEPENPTFKDHDFLNRKDTGDQLTRLIQTVHSPLVIAVDGEWGSGKSHFLKCWNNEEKEGITSVYVDAFKQDYLDDPLISLVSALDAALPPLENTDTVAKKGMSKIKKIAPVLGRLALRTGVSYATLGAVRNIDEVFSEGTESDIETVTKGAISEASQKVIEETETFWQAENCRKSAMEAFRKALEELTIPNEDGEPTHNITIIVDELDRCRPDYALNMLEVIKHFFDIDGINFVLGVNMTSLEESVKARYGAGIDAPRYLQKFLTANIRLPMKLPSGQMVPIVFFDKTLVGMDIDELYPAREYIEHAQERHSLSLRSLQRFIVMFKVNDLIQRPHPQFQSQEKSIAEQNLVAGLIVLKVFFPDLLGLAKSLQLDWETADDALCLTAPYETQGHYPWVSKDVWRACTLDAHMGGDEVERMRRLGFSRRTLAELASEHLDTITLHD